MLTIILISISILLTILIIYSFYNKTEHLTTPSDFVDAKKKYTDLDKQMLQMTSSTDISNAYVQLKSYALDVSSASRGITNATVDAIKDIQTYMTSRAMTDAYRNNFEKFYDLSENMMSYKTTAEIDAGYKLLQQYAVAINNANPNNCNGDFSNELQPIKYFYMNPNMLKKYIENKNAYNIEILKLKNMNSEDEIEKEFMTLVKYHDAFMNSNPIDTDISNNVVGRGIFGDRPEIHGLAEFIAYKQIKMFAYKCAYDELLWTMTNTDNCELISTYMKMIRDCEYVLNSSRILNLTIPYRPFVKSPYPTCNKDNDAKNKISFSKPAWLTDSSNPSPVLFYKIPGFMHSTSFAKNDLFFDFVFEDREFLWSVVQKPTDAALNPVYDSSQKMQAIYYKLQQIIKQNYPNLIIK